MHSEINYDNFCKVCGVPLYSGDICSVCEPSNNLESTMAQHSTESATDVLKYYAEKHNIDINSIEIDKAFIEIKKLGNGTITTNAIAHYIQYYGK